MLYDKILKYAHHFEKAAAFDFDGILSAYKGAIQKELSVGTRNLAKLLSTDVEAAKSQSLKSINDAYGKLSALIDQITPSGASLTTKDMKQIIGQAKFYTSTQNAGTGYDPKTKEGGATSPAAYLKRIENYVNKLDSYSKYFDGLKLSPKAKPKPAPVQAPAEPAPVSEVAETLPQLPAPGYFAT